MANTNHLGTLNKIQALFIEHANETGLNLAEHFKTTDDFKQFIIGLAFRGLFEAGVDAATAFDAVLGKGQYDALLASMTS